MKRFEIIDKFYSLKVLLKMAGGGMHLPHPLPGSAPASHCRDFVPVGYAASNLRNCCCDGDFLITALCFLNREPTSASLPLGAFKRSAKQLHGLVVKSVRLGSW